MTCKLNFAMFYVNVLKHQVENIYTVTKVIGSDRESVKITSAKALHYFWRLRG